MYISNSTVIESLHGESIAVFLVKGIIKKDS